MDPQTTQHSDNSTLQAILGSIAVALSAFAHWLLKKSKTEPRPSKCVTHADLSAALERQDLRLARQFQDLKDTFAENEARWSEERRIDRGEIERHAVQLRALQRRYEGAGD